MRPSKKFISKWVRSVWRQMEEHGRHERPFPARLTLEPPWEREALLEMVPFGDGSFKGPNTCTFTAAHHTRRADVEAEPARNEKNMPWKREGKGGAGGRRLGSEAFISRSNLEL